MEKGDPTQSRKVRRWLDRYRFFNHPCNSSIKKILTVLQEEWQALESDSAETEHETPLTSEHRRLALSLSPLLAFETSISQDQLHKLGRMPLVTPESQSPTDETSNDPSQVAQVLAGCKNEVIALWDDAVVRDVLKSHGVYLQDDSGLCALRCYLMHALHSI